LEKPTGKITATIGSNDKQVMTAEVGGPAPFMGKKGGFYAYVLSENSGAITRTVFKTNDYPTSFDYDLTDSIRLQFANSINSTAVLRMPVGIG